MFTGSNKCTYGINLGPTTQGFQVPEVLRLAGIHVVSNRVVDGLTHYYIHNAELSTAAETVQGIARRWADYPRAVGLARAPDLAVDGDDGPSRLHYLTNEEKALLRHSQAALL